jgi:hypothetical protein
MTPPHSSASSSRGTPGLTPSLTPSGTITPSTTVPATPVEEICTTQHAMYAFDVLAAKFAQRDPVGAPFENAKDK